MKKIIRRKSIRDDIPIKLMGQNINKTAGTTEWKQRQSWWTLYQWWKM